jgi:hypothetical protein
LRSVALECLELEGLMTRERARLEESQKGELREGRALGAGAGRACRVDVEALSERHPRGCSWRRTPRDGHRVEKKGN